MSEEAARKIAEANEVFERDVGAWDSDVEIRPGPDAPVVRMKGTYHNRRIAGGRWLVVEYRSDGGFEGHGVYGWDDARGRYVGIWVDSTQSAIAQSEGTWDPSSRTMTYVTTADLAGRTLRYREVMEGREDGAVVYRNFMPGPDGREYEMIHIVSRRRS